MEIHAGLEEMDSGPPRDLGLGLVGPQWIEAPFDSPDLPYVVVLKAVYDDDRYEIAELRCTQRPDGPAVTGEGIRQLPVGEMLTFAVVGALASFNQNVFQSRPVRPQITDGETLAYVAKLYRSAYVSQEDPAVAVMQNLTLPRATAGRWIRRARDRGFLSDAAPYRPRGSR